MPAAFSIPTVDLATDSPARQAETIKHALSSVGFLCVVNSGIDPDLIDTMFEHSATLFNLPMSAKEAFLSGASGTGYTKTCSQGLGEGKVDHKECLSPSAWNFGKYCAETVQPMPDPVGFGTPAYDDLKRFYRGCHDVSVRLLELFALALGLPWEHFKQYHSWGVKNAYSMIHYPAISGEGQKALGERDIRVGEHQDWGTLTLLFQRPDGGPGLEAYLPASLSGTGSAAGKAGGEAYEWYPAPIPPRGGFLVNVGLGMELWSSGTYRATKHRVVFPQSDLKAGEEMAERYSIAFFVQPDDDVHFQPVLPGGIIDHSFTAITSGELFHQKMMESYERAQKMGLSTMAAAY